MPYEEVRKHEETAGSGHSVAEMQKWWKRRKETEFKLYLAPEEVEDYKIPEDGTESLISTDSYVIVSGADELQIEIIVPAPFANTKQYPRLLHGIRSLYQCVFY
jgi:3-oxoacyl-ACP reductase-like protein